MQRVYIELLICSKSSVANLAMLVILNMRGVFVNRHWKSSIKLFIFTNQERFLDTL